MGLSLGVLAAIAADRPAAVDAPLGVVLSAVLVAAGAEIADPLVGLAIPLVILRITWHSWLTVRGARPAA